VKAKGELISARGVSKSYQKGSALIPVLDNVDFTIDHGEMVSIVGASGAGKSTLLHLLGALDLPDKGELYYCEKSLAGLSSRDLADFRNRELGFVFQFHHLLPEFTALENVMMPGLVARLSRQDARERAEKAIDSVGLTHRLGHKPGELSGGEQQRIALARALVLEPPLLLADEVTGNLDRTTGDEIHDLLFRLNEERGITLVVVTHNQALADRMPRRLVLADHKVTERE